MTTDADRLAEVELDAAQRHRALREQFKEWERSSYDGHGRRSLAGPAMDQLRKRAKRRRAKQRAQQRIRTIAS